MTQGFLSSGDLPPLGQATMAASLPVAIASNQSAIPISAASLPLPTGAATEATLSALNTKVPSQGQATMAASTPVVIASNQSAIPISAASLPLPTGAATEATLAAILANTPALGQATMAASSPVVIASNQSAVPISAASLPLPTGAATEATLSSLNTRGQTAMAGALPVVIASNQSAVPISAASLPLPTGASTEATLSALNTKVPSQGQATMAASVPVVIASNQSAIPTTITGTIPLPTGAATEATLSAINTKIPVQGQAVMAASSPVVIASNQTAIPISAASLPLPTGAATEATLASLNTRGQALMAASLPVVIASNQSAIPISAASLPLPTGAATEATLSSINGKTPALGQATMAASSPVVIASNQSAIPISAASLPLPTGAATEATLASILANTPALGQATMAASSPVVIASNQSAIPISATSLPLPTGAATEATLSALNTKVPSQGQATMAASMPVVIASNQTAIPCTDTRLPAAFGQQTQSTSLAVAQATEQVQDQFITGQAGQSAAGNNIFLAVAGATSTDTVGAAGLVSYRSFYCQIIGSAGIASGQVIFEGSNDNVTFNPLTVYDDAVVTGAPINAALSIAASTNRFFSGKTCYKFVRCRISTVFAGGTVQAITRFTIWDYVPRILTVAQATAANLNATVTATNLSTNIAQIGGGTVANLTATNRVLVTTLGRPVSNTDVASAARTTTGNSGTIARDGGGTIAASLNITAASGTTPTLDVVLQESNDDGTTWVDVYHAPRFTAAGTFKFPPLPAQGRTRWSWTITGTTPSFTFAITTMQGSAAPPIQRAFYDRAVSLNGTTGGTAFDIEGCKSLSLLVTVSAQTTPATVVLEGSPDGTNWGALSATVASAVGTVIVANTGNLVAKFGRVRATVAGTGITLTQAAIVGTN